MPKAAGYKYKSKNKDPFPALSKVLGTDFLFVEFLVIMVNIQKTKS